MADLRMKVFCKVAELGSFSKAGEALFLTQPGVTFHIKMLEEEIGSPLFVRQHSSISLTPAGEIMLKHGREILDLYESMEREIHALTGSMRGHLSIGIAAIMGHYSMPRIIGAFKKKYPLVEMTTHIGNSGDLLDSLKNGDFDLAIVGGPVEERGLEKELFLQDELVLNVPPNHRWAERKQIDLAELRKEPFILREEGSSTRDTLAMHLKAKRIKLANLNVVMTLGSTEAIKAAVQSEVGVSIVSHLAIENELRFGLFQKVDIRGMQLSRSFYIVLPPGGARLSLAAEEFLDFLRHHRDGVDAAPAADPPA
ncbi:MAG TPA: selenium metabolism-associated LysR family transcriptional regulator [Chloroflexota bacterium]|nr:selenium metabolism-associated LysR family transcriptional regulator [Chloroflexota bacterium]